MKQKPVRVLFLAQLPPPVHGVSTVSQQVYDIFTGQTGVHSSRFAEKPAELTYVWAGSAASLRDINKRSLKKYVDFGLLILKLIWFWVTFKRFDFAYLTFAPATHAAVRDGLIAFFARKLARRTLLHLHGQGLEKILHGNDRKARLIGELIRQTELICITSQSQKIAKNAGTFSKVHFLMNFAPVQEAADKPQRRHSQLTIGHMANLDERKGVLIFVDVLKALKEKGHEFKGVIAGAPTSMMDEQTLIEYIERSGLSRNIEYPGSVSGAAKKDFFSALDIFLYPTHHDYAPLVLIEAMSYGIVPVTVPTGGILDIMTGSEENAEESQETLQARLKNIAGSKAESGKIKTFEDQADETHSLVSRVEIYAADNQLLADDKRLFKSHFLQNFTPGDFVEQFETLIFNTN